MALAARITPLRASRAVRVFRPAARFHTSPLRAALNEWDRAENKDRPDTAERTESAKQESLSKANEGRGEWRPELASQSEQSVRHEKHNMTIEEMQAEGAKKAEEGKEPNKSEKATGV